MLCLPIHHAQAIVSNSWKMLLLPSGLQSSNLPLIRYYYPLSFCYQSMLPLAFAQNPSQDQGLKTRCRSANERATTPLLIGDALKNTIQYTQIIKNASFSWGGHQGIDAIELLVADGKLRAYNQRRPGPQPWHQSRNSVQPPW